MTRVDFHFNAADKLAYACRLVRKAWRTGARVVVTGEAAQLRDLDIALWTFAPLEFLPHCHAGAQGESVQARSPVVLAEAPRSAPHHDVLVNLGDAVPEGFERFERLIEVVTPDEQDRQQARARWKHYAGRGYNVDRRDLAAQAG